MKKISTPHSDEYPEAGEGGGDIGYLVSDEEGSATDDLYKNKERRLGVRPDENVIYYEEYIPDVQHGRED